MFAENLKKIRKDKGYTQEILAEKLNVVRQTVSKWEKGLSLPDVDMLSKIANVLETDVNILLDGQITTTDQSEIVKQLAKINEQLTIKNRRYKGKINFLFLKISPDMNFQSKHSCSLLFS